MRKCQDKGTAKGKKLSTEVRIDADTIYCDDYLCSNAALHETL